MKSYKKPRDLRSGLLGTRPLRSRPYQQALKYYKHQKYVEGKKNWK